MEGEIKMVVFYDRTLRLWTAYAVDADGNQIGNAEYGTNKQQVIYEVKRTQRSPTPRS